MIRPLLVDIETCPNLSYVWGHYEQDVIKVSQSWYVLSVAWKRLGDKKINVKGLPDYLGYPKDKTNDKYLIKEIWSLLDSSEVVVAHNGDRFDLPKLNSRFVFHGMGPPSPYKSIDTLKISRKYFKFNSNRLNDLGLYLGLGSKLPHTGSTLWFSAMSGDLGAWRKMKAYNQQDVALLEAVYLKLRPWASNHPRLSDYTKNPVCPTCQSQKIQQRGIAVTRTGHRARMQCQECGAWFQGLKHYRDTV